MKLFYQLSIAALATALIAVPQTANAQRGNDDIARSRGEIERNRRNDDWDYRNRRDDRPGRRVGQDDEWYRKHRAKRLEWCRRHQNDRRCDEFFTRRSGSNWCWDTNRDGRCDDAYNRRRDDVYDPRYDDRRRDSRSGVMLPRDRGPEWERYLRANGFNLSSVLPGLIR